MCVCLVEGMSISSNSQCVKVKRRITKAVWEGKALRHKGLGPDRQVKDIERRVSVSASKVMWLAGSGASTWSATLHLTLIIATVSMARHNSGRLLVAWPLPMPFGSVERYVVSFLSVPPSIQGCCSLNRLESYRLSKLCQKTKNSSI